ncbi:MAG TPA: DMT family transporter [Amnibacterium sp.]|uniref:DMT family transporter n=1 Tax=Amnibacterium sp. TaxID=1872496 RepID=UPI002F94F966
MVAVLGIPVAVVAAVLLALGAQLQNQGATRVEEQADPGGSRNVLERLIALLSTPRWLGGSTILGIAVALQLVSLLFAPIAVVQPIGALALVITVLLDTRMNRARIPGRAKLAIVICLAGVTTFVVTASLTTSSGSPRALQTGIVLAVLGGVLLVAGALLLVLRGRPSALRSALTAALLFGFVATLAKLVIGRLQHVVQSGSGFQPVDWLTLGAVLALLLAGTIGLGLVQAAYAAGSPDLVVAALTVVDPLVAVTIGIAVLGEAASAPPTAFAVFVAAGIVAIGGVLLLARHQPEAGSRDRPADRAASRSRP